MKIGEYSSQISESTMKYISYNVYLLLRMSTSVTQSCRFCTTTPLSFQTCPKCKQTFCDAHFTEHNNIVQQLVGKAGKLAWGSYCCTTKVFYISEDFVQLTTPQLFYSLISNLSGSSIELHLSSNKNSLEATQKFIIEASKPKNIKQMS